MLGLRMLNTWTHCNLNFPLQIEFMQQIGIKFLVIIVNYFPSSCLENTKKIGPKVSLWSTAQFFFHRSYYLLHELCNEDIVCQQKFALFFEKKNLAFQMSQICYLNIDDFDKAAVRTVWQNIRELFFIKEG